MRNENINNVYARYKYLLAGIKNVKLVDKEHIPFLSGQRKFSDLSVDGYFSALSLNTMKSAAKECLVNEASVGGDGFKYLDDLRCKLYNLVKDRGDRRTKKDIQNRSSFQLKEAKAEKEKSDKLNIVLTKAYFELLKQIISLSKSEQTPEKTRLRVQSIIENHIALYEGIIEPEKERQEGLSLVKGSKP